VADQIIFTSAVRGIKPGASGYCTVLRSPGIRPALEQALEKLSVFEHTKCNRGRVTYSYRQIEIRDTTYFALSRISDTDKDYTGRTNFLAHHLVFQKEEIPDLSPADILLTWSGWCQQWSGEPREEPVDVQSLQQIPAIKPPVRIWKEQAIGVDGAIKLASDTQSLFVLRSKECTDSSLLQLVAEALAVRAKFNQSYKYTWTTSFSVGLAAVGSAKTFKWLVVRDADDYALPKAGTLIDLDTTLPGGTTANEELSAIAREGEFRPAAKPIPLSSEKSIADRLSTPESGGGAAPRGQRGRPVGKHEPRILKLGLGHEVRNEAGNVATSPPKKRKWLYTLVCLVILLVAAGGVWFYLDQAQPSVNQNYERQYNDMLDLYDKHIDGGGSTDFRGEVEDVFRRMYAAKNTQSSNRSLDEILQEMQGIDWGIISPTDEFDKNSHAEAFNFLREYLLKETKSESSGKSNDVSDAKLVTGNGEEGNSKAKAPEVAIEAPKEAAPVSIPLDLNQYKKVVLLQSGAELEIKGKDHNRSKFKVTKGIERIEALNDDQSYIEYSLKLSADYLVPASGNGGHNIPINSRIPDESESYAIRINSSSDTQELLVILGGNFTGTLKLGEIALEGCTAQKAFDTLNERFGAGSLDLWIVADDYSTKERTFDSLTGKNGNAPAYENNTEWQILKILSEQVGDEDVNADTMNKFNEWASKGIIEQLGGKKAAAEKSESKNAPKEARTKSERLAKAYQEIMAATKKTPTIKGYFEAYQEELDVLEKERIDPTNSGVKKGLDSAYDDLFNAPKRFKIEPAGRLYRFEWEEGEKSWTLELEGNFNAKDEEGFRANRSGPQLNDYLLEHMKLKEDAEENKKKKDKAEKDKQDYEKSRVWERIEFRPTGDNQPIATVEIK